MARLDVNRSGELEVFVRSVELGGFSAAARALGMTPSAVSKLVARLEARLGARLLNRSTRNLQLTPEGCVFYERGVRVLAELDETERGAALGATPRGRLRVHANVPLGRHYLLPLAPAFLDAHPDITLDIVLTDQVVDLLEQRTDVAIRSGPLKDSQLVARKLGDAGMVIVGAPAYLARHGTPGTPADLHAHNRLGFGFARAANGWPLLDEDGRSIDVPVEGNALVSDGETLRQLAVAGVGLARLASFQVRDDVAAGRLVVLLDAFNPGDTEPVNVLYLGQGGHLPARVRALLDFLVQRMQID
ncbi:LysR family transcriptional regulator [Paraburkholderia fynbosensis]|uniref:HTH-type transcriptional regulator DmlR n=1 Tax=Paraburkholderia fynbosensis TaxID=1200993 RepID=A0A6J5GF57_9BURK|nr:LysR family transcriptional regulator [Paraburkholderia fynbosensis]CAB3799297.1 HTH-type transcriptional regulator DmlR [Paraburkholderia fynbosensis]